MAWVKLSDDFATHPKIIGLSDAALRILVESYCYAARHQTDGEVTDAVARRLGTTKARAELVDAGLWDRTPRGISIHDYLEYNPSRGELAKRRDARSKNGRAGADARWQHRA